MPEPFLLSRMLLHVQQGTEALINNLSTVVQTPDGNLWLGSDELSQVGELALNTVERFSPLSTGGFGNHQPFALRDVMQLTDTAGEIDIEGLDHADSYLWLTGSHSTKRKKPKGKNPEKDIQRLTEIVAEPNRFLIARIPTAAEQLHASYPDPERPDYLLTAACLKREGTENQLMAALRSDPHLGVYIANGIPSKENGLDIEGLAVRKNHLFLGLRGPVLRGWAMLLEINVAETATGELQLQPIGATQQVYQKHFFDLDGLGVRELCFHGDDLLILAGPTMDLAGSQRIYRWRDALHHPSPTMSSQTSGELELLFDLPYSPIGDKAEGMTLFSGLSEAAVLIVYDSPNPARVVNDGVWADIFRLPST